MDSKKPIVLTIAGSDSGGGAGIQADLKTFAALGVHGTSAITALTAQNTKTVAAVHSPPLDFLTKQIETILDDINIGAVKIGMLATADIINTVTTSIKKYNMKNIVLDPVMIATSGAKLLEDKAIKALKKELIPLATVLTPNIPEAEVLANFPIKTEEDAKKAAQEIMKLGCKYVLMKGSHLNKDTVTDILYDGKEFLEIKNKRIPKEGHGTGCTLSSAIAAELAKGRKVEEAVKKAVAYVHTALDHGYKIGSQNYVLDHFAQ